MKYLKIISLTFCLLTFAFGIQAQDGNMGHIYEVDVSVHESLRALAPERDGNGLTMNTVNGGPKLTKEIFTKKEVDELVGEMAIIMEENSKSISEVSAEKSPTNVSANKKLGSIGKGIANEGMLGEKASYFTMEYFPGKPLKKVLSSGAIEFYDIKAKVTWGGNKGQTIVMNKVKSTAYVKYNVTMTIVAKDVKKKEIWKKKKTSNDFSSTVDGFVDKKYFKIEGRETVSIDDIGKSILVAFEETMKSE
jgi:hypothetical protein